jgi:uncharacterized protein
MPNESSHRAFTLSLLPDLYAILKFPSNATVPEWLPSTVFSSITRTADELSIVGPVAHVPPQYPIALKWRIMKVHGPLAFTEVGVLDSLTGPLRAADIGIFVISTYETDYLLITVGKADAAVAALKSAGHHFAEG